MSSKFYLRISNRTFEHYSGYGYIDNGGIPEQLMPLEQLSSLYLSVADDLYDEKGQIIGVRIKDSEDGTLYDVLPGKVYNIRVWTTTVDDDGCPEDICICYYLEIIPAENIASSGLCK